MLFFALSGIVIGAMLGGLTVGSVFPAIILVLLIAGTLGVLGGETIAPGTIEVGLLVIGLQLGYLAGAGLRFHLFDRGLQAAKLVESFRAKIPAGTNSSSLRD